ncbi:MAG: polyprenyl synthetase family protein [Planctomycetaceae bacterium]
MSNPLTGSEWLARIDDVLGGELREVEAIYAAELQSASPYVRDILAQASRFRGKRLRPMLLLLTAAAGGGIRRDHRVLAAVVEMIHTATLVHDDVLDEAATRRHVATVNNRWNNETSVLFGDYLFTHSFHLAASLKSTAACRLIGRSTNIICEGELTQIRERGNLELSESDYLKIIDGKTAELCALCCRLGALYAEATDTVIQAAERFGRGLGMAFQIADDILDLIGKESQTGKTLGSDFAKQKLTLPLIRLLATSGEPESTRLRELLLRADEESCAAVRELLLDGDGLHYARNRALEFAASARESLAPLPDTESRRVLEEMTDFAALRSF